MLKDTLSTFTEAEQAKFCCLVGTSWNVISTKYLRTDSMDRAKPRQPRFETLLNAINTIRPGSISREQLASYFYAAPAGQDRGQGADAA